MTGEMIYVDPSALAGLYVHQERSREMNAWRSRMPGMLPVTHHGRTEIINAICRLAFVGQLDQAAMNEALADVAGDFAGGRLVHVDILWRAALNRAAGLSQSYTPSLGTRSLDVLHVACALELKLPYFLTFDARQQKLARAAGLKTIKI